MSKPSDPAENRDNRLEQLIGLGEHSIRKSYYPELQQRLGELERFRALLDHSNDVIFLIEVPTGQIVDVNASASRLMGLSREELLSRSVFDITGLGDNPAAKKLISDHESGVDKTKPVATDLYRRDGHPIPAEITLSRMVFSDCEYVAAVARDITKRKHAEEDLQEALGAVQESLDKLDTILRSVADGLIVTDAHNRIIMINPTTQSLLGIAPDTAVGQDIETLDSAKALVSQVKATLSGHPPASPAEWEIPNPNDQWPRTIQAHSAVVQNKDQAISGAVTILRDVSRDRELDRMKNAFISRAAHELRTPLTSVMGFADLLLKQEEYGISDPAQQLEFLSRIVEKSERLSEIIDDIMDLSRVQTGRAITLDKKPCHLPELLARVVAPYQKTAPGHRFEIILPHPMPPLLLDRRRIEQVLENLLSNAVKYSPQGGLIRLAVEKTDQDFTVSVKDKGIGMSPEQVENIFDNFYRADLSDTAIEGLGMGMGIAKGVVEAHGGKIWVHSAAGKGTTVYFTLPQ